MMGAPSGTGSREPSPSVSAASGFDPSRKEARIWGYARALKKALIQIAPEDFRMEWVGGGNNNAINVSCTITTAYEAEAVCEIIMRLANLSLTHHREMVRGDIYPDQPEPSFSEELAAMFGSAALLKRASSEDEGLTCVDCGRSRSAGSAARCRACYRVKEPASG